LVKRKGHLPINPLTPELNPSAQICLPRFLLGILIVKGSTARRIYKSFGVKGLTIFPQKLRTIQNTETLLFGGEGRLLTDFSIFEGWGGGILETYPHYEK
jgi:hypothetical protein